MSPYVRTFGSVAFLSIKRGLSRSTSAKAIAVAQEPAAVMPPPRLPIKRKTTSTAGLKKALPASSAETIKTSRTADADKSAPKEPVFPKAQTATAAPAFRGLPSSSNADISHAAQNRWNDALTELKLHVTERTTLLKTQLRNEFVDSLKYVKSEVNAVKAVRVGEAAKHEDARLRVWRLVFGGSLVWLGVYAWKVRRRGREEAARGA